MDPRRVPALALVADLVAVVVFAAIGRISHAEADSILGLIGTALPFALGVVAAWATPWVRAAPTTARAGAVVLAGSVVVGFVLRLGFLDRLPLSFAVVATISLAVLLLGWRGLAAVVAYLRTREPSQH
ncbi:DUF3054 domain-containing protein [Pseudonocardia phyllosphaerae]|uniref:DUF3054 domain-containing protein n=1 Tax=Pseudonocardia phyllosphaerae TaxID=3390502 RepID=UPI00397E64B0